MTIILTAVISFILGYSVRLFQRDRIIEELYLDNAIQIAQLSLYRSFVDTIPPKYWSDLGGRLK